jgi:hypothetical protein
MKRAFSILIFAKRLIDRFRVGWGDDRGHNRGSYGISGNSANASGRVGETAKRVQDRVRTFLNANTQRSILDSLDATLMAAV